MKHIPHADYDAQWRAAMAPRTGNVRHELTLEAAGYLGLSFDEVQQRIDDSVDAFPAEWNRMVSDPSYPQQLVRFYNESTVELYEQIAWHATEPIHHRSIVNLARQRPGREFLDYGSGIGSNALVFGLAGFRVTLADIADPLRSFAEWRCQRRGVDVRSIDLKCMTLERGRYDVITCFDVLEHVPDPIAALQAIRDALRPDGLLFVYAPFGLDPERPMRVVHDDGARRRIRSLGLSRCYEWEDAFPPHVYPPTPYRRVSRRWLANRAYFERDVWLTGQLADSIVSGTRSAISRRRRRRSPRRSQRGTGAA